MIINKYNSAKAKGLTRAGISTGAISSVSSSTSVVSGGDLDRELWGQKDEGGDIDGSMWVNGSLYLGAIDYSEDDTEDEEAVDDSNYVDNAETGSLIADALVQSRDMYCKEHPYITYPIVGGQKTDLRELFSGFDERIQNNTGEITKLKAKVTTNTSNITSSIADIQNLDTRVTTLEGQISSSENLGEIKTRLTTCETNITNNTSEINKLKTRVTNLENNGGGGGGITDSMPIGSIIMYNGKAEDIPQGWAICDGMLGTPNLVDRFVLGSFTAGGTGGASQITLTAEQLPKHSHKVNAWYGKSGSTGGSGNGLQSSPIGQQVSTEEAGNNEAINIMPPYYRLIYIMKIGTTATTTDTTQTT